MSSRRSTIGVPTMVEPVGFIEAWKAQFPESEPPKMELRSVVGIEQELEKCKASIRRLEMEVNKERFRMIYLQTLLAKERKSYDRQRWGFRGAAQPSEGERPPGADHQSSQHMLGQEQGHGDRSRFHPVGEERSRTRPLAPRRSSSHGDGLEPVALGERHQPGVPGELDRCRHYGEGEADKLSPSKQRGGTSYRRPGAVPLMPSDKEGLPDTPKDKPGMGLGVAALRSNFERAKRGNWHSFAEGKAITERPLYANMEYHQDRGLMRVNEREGSDAMNSPGSQAVQMERQRSLAKAAVEVRRPVLRGRSAEGHSGGYEAEGEEAESESRPSKEGSVQANGGRPHHQHPPPPWQPSDFQSYSGVYVGGSSGEGDGRGTGKRDDAPTTWPRRSYSPGSFEDTGGGGYTPDCSSNENLTSSEEDFSSGQSSHVSPSPTAHRPFPGREKSRSPSQNSQQSLDSSSPPTPQTQKRHKHHVLVSEASVVSIRKTGQIWPNESNSTLSSRTSHDNSFHGDLGKYLTV
ncbi:hypothetical protein GN956_G23637 [Arapaima gigas]